MRLRDFESEIHHVASVYIQKQILWIWKLSNLISISADQAIEDKHHAIYHREGNKESLFSDYY